MFEQYTMLHEYNDEVNKVILNIIAFIEENREGLKREEDFNENDVSVLSNTVYVIAKIFRNMCLSSEGRANINCFVPWDDVFDFCVNSDCDDTKNSILQVWCEILYRQEMYISQNGNGASISLAMDSLYIKLLDNFMNCTQIGVKKFGVITVYNRLQREDGYGEFIMKLLADDFFENAGDIALVSGVTAEDYVNILFIVLKYIHETKQRREVFQEVMKSCEVLNEIVEEAEDNEDFQEAAEKCNEIFSFIEETKDE